MKKKWLKVLTFQVGTHIFVLLNDISTILKALTLNPQPYIHVCSYQLSWGSQSEMGESEGYIQKEM